MEKPIFSEEVTQSTKQRLEKIESELDLNFCIQNNIKFINDEVDTMEVDLFDEDIANLAFDVLYRSSEK